MNLNEPQTPQLNIGAVISCKIKLAMEDWTNPQNEAFSKIFDALKQKANPTYKGDALTLLHLNDENFIKLYRDTTELTGEQEDIDLCMQRAVHLGCA